jgi:cytosine/adenosine deaminase-related metal-dependent hydrolase
VSDRLLFRGGCVLTLGARTPNHPEADVLVADGTIAEVGRGLRARDAEVVDATDAIVMPGFVDTHRHAWRSLFRNLGDRPAIATEDLGGHYGPDEVYAATLIGLLGAAEAGITTVVDWCDLSLDDGRAEAALQAHADAGLRSVLVPAASPAAGAELRGLRDRLPTGSPAATGIAVGCELAGDGLERVARARALARELGVPFQVHAGSRAPGAVARLGERGLLDEGVTIVHGAGLDDADLGAIAGSGASVSLAPSSEMGGGLGSPPIQELIDRDVRPGLGVDDERVAPGDLFAQMRATISLQHATVFDRKLAGKAGLPKLMSTRDVIRSATSQGARVAGLREATGSIEPGKQADLIVLRTDRPNIFPINDPIGAVVWGMDTSNVDWVIAGGRVLMREGVLRADVAAARDVATAARERVAAAAGLVAGAAPGSGR